jgi:integrase
MINTLYKRGRIWWLKYRLQGEDTKAACVSLNTSDKQVAEKRRSDLVNELERERAGIISPKEMREAACRDVSELVGEFAQDLRARGRAEKYASNLETRLKTLASECGWKLLRDATADSFVSWRSRQTELKAKTLNEYLNAACGLLNWLQRNGRMVANPLKVVGKVEMRGVETRQRRGLTEDELRQLIAVSGSRKAVYLVAAFTGLRRGELEQLEWSDVHIDDCPEAFIEARASTTKNHKKATIKLHSDVVSALREWKTANGGKSERVFRVPKIETFRGDLKRAGIVYKDAQGRFADFHFPACHPLYKSTAGGRS